MRTALAALLCVSAIHADELILTAKDHAPLFADFRVEPLTLSADGAPLAQVVRAGPTLKFVLVEVDPPWLKRSVFVGEHENAAASRTKPSPSQM